MSAKHGVLNPNKKIDPYNYSVTNMDKDEREKWYRKVKAQMKRLGIWSLSKIFVCGKLYQGPFKGKNVFPRGLGMGDQMRFLKRKMDKRKTLL